MGLISLMGLIGCSEEQADDSKSRLTLEVVPCAPMFIDDGEGDAARAWTTPEGGVTRAWTTPEGYVTYDAIYGTSGMFPTQKNLVNKSIDAFFTQNAAVDPEKGTFFYYGTDENEKDLWRLSMEIQHPTSFYLYGFIPSEVASSSSIEKIVESASTKPYSEGAVLKLNGIKTVTPSDVCVIIGAMNGSSYYKPDADYIVTGLQPGTFLVNAQASTLSSAGSGNYIFLLFDHLYSAIRVNFTVGEKYDALRTIKLRGLEMIPYSDRNKTKVNAKYNATIKLEANTTGASPIASVTFVGDATSGDATFEPLFNGEEKLEHGKVTRYMGCFIPGQTQYFSLRSTYDVYDKKGNLIREGCVAENFIDLQYMLNTSNILRGHMYSLTLEVTPTYLYVLSDPDLDSPTVVVN